MGTLYLPSLKEKKFLVMHNVSEEEAIEFIDDFSEKVKNNRKIKNVGSHASNFELFKNIINDAAVDPDFFATEIFDMLSVSDARGIRGSRAIFAEEDGTFGVGTAVIYNQNWASINFSDNTILSKIEKNFELDI